MKFCRIVGVAAALGLGLSATSAFGALATAGGESGFSGTLSSNKTIRQQQLICDPVGAPMQGRTSIDYDPAIVKLTAASLGPGYFGQSLIEVAVGPGETQLVDMATYLASPTLPQTGYIQLCWNQSPVGVQTPLPSPGGSPGQIPVANGFNMKDNDGPFGTDTYQLRFDYLATVPSTAVAGYDIYAIGPENSHGSTPDFMRDANNNLITFDQISSAHVEGNLESVPLPPGAWAGIAMLGALAGVTLWKRRIVAR